ncbi:hypothetical protein ACFOU2_04000 [Bacillus songklensis]|uniref:Lipoprotein n=1 Tax=Bacillus songklensis TaxID=1069116 RepID=A0ABV8AXJ1_9BACI
MRIPVSICLAALLLGACSNDKPKPETRMEVVPMNVVQTKEEAVETLKSSSNRSMIVHQHVRGNNVYVECIVNNFSFAETGQNTQDGKGYLQLYVDGKRMEPISQAAFIIKNLAPGKHTIQLELMKSSKKSYGLSKTFEVVI